MRFCNVSMFCCALLCVHSSFAIISMGRRELVALLCLSSWCLVIVVWLFLTIPWVCLQFVIVVFPDHTHYFWSLICGCGISKLCVVTNLVASLTFSISYHIPCTVNLCKWPFSKRLKIGFQNQLSLLNEDLKYCRMLQRGAFCKTFDLH